MRGFLATACPPLTSHGVIFRAPWGEIRSVIAEPDPDQASDDELRRVLTAELERRVLSRIILHAFQKKSRRAIATPKGELDLIGTRLSRAKEDYEAWLKSR